MVMRTRCSFKAVDQRTKAIDGSPRITPVDWQSGCRQLGLVGQEIRTQTSNSRPPQGPRQVCGPSFFRPCSAGVPISAILGLASHRAVSVVWGRDLTQS